MHRLLLSESYTSVIIYNYTRENNIIAKAVEKAPLRMYCVTRKWRRIFVLSASTRSMVRVHWPVTCRSTHCLLSMCWYCIDCFVCAMDDGVRVYNAEPLVEKCRIGGSEILLKGVCVGWGGWGSFGFAFCFSWSLPLTKWYPRGPRPLLGVALVCGSLTAAVNKWRPYAQGGVQGWIRHCT